MSPTRRSIRLYRLLLHAYPAAFREAWGDEMAETAAALLERERSRGRAGRSLLAARLLLDVVAGGLAERRRTRHEPGPARRPSPRRKPMLDGLAAELRQAARALRRSPFQTLAVVATLALGIGVTTALYSVVHATLLAPLPFADPESLVLLWEDDAERGWVEAQVSPANFFDWQEQTRSFTALAGFSDWLDQVVVSGPGDRPAQANLMFVVGDLFGTVGVAPALGRSFRPGETWEGETPVAILSHDLWQRSFGGDPGVVGRLVPLDGNPHEVVGVMPEGFALWTPDVDVWRPFGWAPEERTATWFRRAHMFRAVGRLAPGVSPPEAGAELAAVARRLAAEYPETNRNMGAGVTPLAAWIVGDLDRPLLLLLGATALVLLIACANVTHLQLARAVSRARETAVRGCLGATPWRLGRQTLLEVGLLAAGGGAGGLALAIAAVPRLVALAPPDLPRLGEVAVDLPVLAFATGISLASALLAGLVPAWRHSRPDLEATLRESGRGGEGPGTGRFRRLLVAGEVALAVLVLVGASLLLRSLRALDDLDPGFRATGVYTAQLVLPRASYPDPAALESFTTRFLAEARSLPGVTSAGLVSKLPLAVTWTSDFAIEGRGREEYGVDARHREVTPGALEALGVELLAGRAFTESDDGDAEAPAVIVNRTLAEAYFPGESPLGQRLCFDRYPEEGSFWRTVVGVVPDVRQESLAEPPGPEIYSPLAQEPTRGLAVVVHTTGDPGALARPLEAALAAVDPGLPLFAGEPLATRVDASLARERFVLLLFSLFAGLSVVLAALGVYGVTADAVARRRREVGLRLALGARAGEVVREIAGRELVAVLAGLGGGLAAAVALGRAMTGLLYGVRPADPASLLAASAVLLTVAALAAWLPARRSARVAPFEALRE